MSNEKQKSTGHGKTKARAKTAPKARRAVERKTSGLHETAKAVTSEARDLVEKVTDAAREEGGTLREDCAGYIRNHPWKAVALAGCAGFLLGIAVRK